VIISVISISLSVFIIDALFTDHCTVSYLRRLEPSGRSMYAVRSEMSFYIPGVSGGICHAQGESSVVKLNRCSQKYVYPKSCGYKFYRVRTDAHVLITKYVLKRGVICNTSNVSTFA
jgi:hypothetical protein